MCEELIVSWQNPRTRTWLPVGWLSHVDEVYYFEYTEAAYKAIEEKAFVPLAGMKDLFKKYASQSLFPVFKNRLLSKSRPEYMEYLSWLGLEGQNITDMDELKLSGGIRATDNLQLHPVPKQEDGKYIIRFFAHGIRHFSECSQKRTLKLKQGDTLFLMKDIQNKFDETGKALLLRTDDPPENLGYCPRFLSEEFSILLDSNDIGATNVVVTKVNEKSPLHFRLLCEFTSPWPSGFSPFSAKSFKRLKEVPTNDPSSLLQQA